MAVKAVRSSAAEVSVKAFGYLRVSVDEEDGNNASIQSQEAEIKRYAAARGIEIVAFFADLNVSGRKENRKQFDRMIALACGESRPVDLIISYSLSRFARRLLTQLASEKKLGNAGVTLVTVLEGEATDPNAKLARNMFGLMNEKYSLDASSFTRKDRRNNAEKGY